MKLGITCALFVGMTGCAWGTDEGAYVEDDAGADAGVKRHAPVYEAMSSDVPDWPRTCPPACPEQKLQEVPQPAGLPVYDSRPQMR